MTAIWVVIPLMGMGGASGDGPRAIRPIINPVFPEMKNDRVSNAESTQRLLKMGQKKPRSCDMRRKIIDLIDAEQRDVRP